ncbi:hypothetical protein D9M68_478430 [compost metagenome]
MAASVAPQPLRQRREIPELAQVDAQPEQAGLVQRQPLALRAIVLLVGIALDGEIVGDQDGDPAFVDPAQQALVPAVQHGAAVVQHLRIGIAAHIDQLLAEAGMQAQHVAGLDIDPVRVDHALKRVITHVGPGIAVMGMQVQHDAAPLHAGLGHFLDAQPMRARLGIAGWPHHVHAGAKAVVVHRHRDAVAVHVEVLPDVRQRVPLGRILGVERHRIVARTIDVAGVFEPQGIVHAEQPALARGHVAFRRQPVRVQRRSSGQVQRQAQAEGLARAHFARRLHPPLSRQQVQAAQFVVGAELAPIGARRPVLPALVHVAFLTRRRSGAGPRRAADR